MGTGIKQVKDGCWTFGDGDKVCYPLKKCATLPLKYSDMPEGYPKVERRIVEIVPEQSVAGEHIENHCGILYSGEMNISLNGNTENLVVVINGVKYNATVTVQSSPFGDLYYIGNDYLLNEDSVDTKEPFILCSSSDGFRADWRTELGETITLAIYEEQESVKPLDPKFGGGVNIIRAVENGIYLNDEFIGCTVDKVVEETNEYIEFYDVGVNLKKFTKDVLLNSYVYVAVSGKDNFYGMVRNFTITENEAVGFVTDNIQNGKNVYNLYYND